MKYLVSWRWIRAVCNPRGDHRLLILLEGLPGSYWLGIIPRPSRSRFHFGLIYFGGTPAFLRD